MEWRKLEHIRPMIPRFVRLTEQEGVTERLKSALLPTEQLVEAIVRLVIEYPRDWETLIDEAALRETAAEAFEFQLVKRPQVDQRIRLPGDQAIGSLTPLELLEKYWQSIHMDSQKIENLNRLAAQILEIQSESK